MRLLLALRQLGQHRDRDRARQWQARLAQELDPETRRRAEAFRSRFVVARQADAVGLGHHLVPSPPVPVGMSFDELLSRHAWVTGATGSGKTFFVLGLLIELLRRSLSPIVVVDLKGELSRLLQDLILPGLAAGSHPPPWLAHVRIIRPYGSSFIPLLRLTAPEEGIAPEVQALGLAAGLEEALGKDLGIRMERLFLKLSCLAIELGEPLTAIHGWLERPVSLARDALRSSNASLRAYVRQSFERETAASREALLARLDAFLLLPETRLALSAPRCLSLKESLERGVTIINLGEPPAGAERVVRFWAGVLVGRLSRAILSREIQAGSPPALVLFEEFQEALSGAQVEQFKRLLALARYKRVSLWFVNQQVGQLSAVDPSLPKILRTNTGLEALFRCNAEDARLLAPVLASRKAVRGRVRPDPASELMSLKDREFMFWAKRESFGPQRLRAEDLDLEGFQVLARSLSPVVRRGLDQGTEALPRQELEALRESRRARSEERMEQELSPSERSSAFPVLG